MIATRLLLAAESFEPQNALATLCNESLWGGKGDDDESFFPKKIQIEWGNQYGTGDVTSHRFGRTVT